MLLLELLLLLLLLLLLYYFFGLPLLCFMTCTYLQGEDHARSQPNVTIEKHKKQFSQVLAEIRERAMSSS